MEEQSIPVRGAVHACPWGGTVRQVIRAADTESAKGTAELDESTEVHRGWIMPDLVGHGEGAGFHPKHKGQLLTNAGMLFL